MPLKVKSASEAAEKWGRKAPLSVSDYIKGIRAPKRPWQAATRASEENYVAGVQAAIARGAFGRGVEDSSDGEWEDMAVTKGATNYPGGIRAGVPKYTRKIQPVLDHMERVTLPPPGPRGSPANIARSVAFQEHMARYRTGG